MNGRVLGKMIFFKWNGRLQFTLKLEINCKLFECYVLHRNTVYPNKSVNVMIYLLNLYVTFVKSNFIQNADFIYNFLLVANDWPKVHTIRNLTTYLISFDPTNRNILHIPFTIPNKRNNFASLERERQSNGFRSRLGTVGLKFIFLWRRDRVH